MNFYKLIRRVFPLLGLIILSSGFVAWGAPPDNFTAKMVMEGMEMPMAKMGNKTRVENPMMQGMITISYMDSGKMVTLSTANKTYMESVHSEKGQAPSIYDPRVVVDKKKIGTDKLDGHSCVKYDAVIYLKDKPEEKFKAVLWEAQDLGGLAIRQEMTIPESKRMGKGTGRMVSELKDIKVGGAKASMFEVPKDYRKVDSMMEVMGGAGGMEKNIQEMMEKMKK